MKYYFYLILIFSISGCSVSKITTQWEYQSGSKIRVSESWWGGIEYNGVLPAFIDVDPSTEYYVEILTPKSQHIYGTLKVYSKTALTELTNVKIVIDESIINNVLDNQVSQITVKDPSANQNIILLNLGNKMPKDMSDLYNRKNIQIF